MQVFVARQPILDKSKNIYAYELLFRTGAINNSYDGTDGEQASSAVLTNSFHAIGMDILTRGRPAFVNFTRNLLVREVPTIFPKDLVNRILESGRFEIGR